MVVNELSENQIAAIKNKLDSIDLPKLGFNIRDMLEDIATPKIKWYINDKIFDSSFNYKAHPVYYTLRDSISDIIDKNTRYEINYRITEILYCSK